MTPDRKLAIFREELRRLSAEERRRRNPHPDDCGRCGGSGYSGLHGDACSRCEGSGVDALGSCEGGCGKRVRESKGMCDACSTADDEARGIVRDRFGYPISAARRPAPGRLLGRRWNPSHNYGCACSGCQ